MTKEDKEFISKIKKTIKLIETYNGWRIDISFMDAKTGPINFKCTDMFKYTNKMIEPFYFIKRYHKSLKESKFLLYSLLDKINQEVIDCSHLNKINLEVTEY